MTWVAAGIASGSATMAGVQYVKGKRDQKKAEQNRPQFEIPEEAKANLNQAQQEALLGMPAAQQQQFINNINQSTAYALAQAGSRKAGLTGVAALNQNQNQAFQGLAVADANMNMQNRQRLFGARNQMADYKGQAFNLNKLNPYYENLAQDQARTAALFQNLNNAAGIAMMGMGNMGGGTGGQQQTVRSIPAANTQFEQAYNTMPNGQESETFNPYAGQQFLVNNNSYNSGFNYGQF